MELEYDSIIDNYLKTTPPKNYKIEKIKELGKGAAGTVTLSKINNSHTIFAVKQVKRNQYSMNECSALKYLRELLLTRTIPNYFIFAYTSFNEKQFKYIIMEYADKCMDTFITEYNVESEKFFEIFMDVTRAVSYLEDLLFNHGDLWTENVMLKWLPGQEGIDDYNKKFMIKLIDYDASFQENSEINSPNLGAGKEFRTQFLLGYDLNRFFDSILYNYNSYIEHKEANKKKKFIKKHGKKKAIPEYIESDTSDEEYDDDNAVYPEEVITFIETLDPIDPEKVFGHLPRLSAKNVLIKLKDV